MPDYADANLEEPPWIFSAPRIKQTRKPGIANPIRGRKFWPYDWLIVFQGWDRLEDEQ